MAPQREECEHLIQHAISVPEVAVHVADGCTHLKRLYQQASGMLTRGDPGLQQSVQQQLLFAQLSLYRLGLRRLGRLGDGRRLPHSCDSMLASFVGDASGLLGGVAADLLRSPFPAYLALHAHALSREQPHLSATQERCGELQGVVAELLPPRVLRAAQLHTLVRLLEAYGQVQDKQAAKVLSHLVFELGHRAEAAVAQQYADLQAVQYKNLKWSGVAAEVQPPPARSDSSPGAEQMHVEAFAPELQIPQQVESLVVTLYGLAGKGQANHPGVRSCLHLLHCAQVQDAALAVHLRAQLLAMLAVSTTAARLPRYAHCHAFHGLLAAAVQRDAFHATSQPVTAGAGDDSRPSSSYLPLFLKAVTEAGVNSPQLALHVAKGLVQGRPLALAAVARWQPSAIMHVLQFLAGQGMPLVELRCEKDASLKSRGGGRGRGGSKATDAANMNPLIPLLEGLQRRESDVRGDTAINCLYSIACLAPAERQVYTTLAPGLTMLSEVCLQHLTQLHSSGTPLGEQDTTLCGKAVFSARVLGGFRPSPGARVHWQLPQLSSASGHQQADAALAKQLLVVVGDSNSRILPAVGGDTKYGALSASLAALAQHSFDLLRMQATQAQGGASKAASQLPQVFLPRLHSVHDVNGGQGGGGCSGASALPRQDDPLQADVLSTMKQVLPAAYRLVPLPLLCNLGVQPDALLLPEGGQGGVAVMVQSWRHCRPTPGQDTTKQPQLLSHAVVVQAGWVDGLLPGALPAAAPEARRGVVPHTRMQHSIQLLQSHGIPCVVVTALQWRKWGNDTQRRNMLRQLLEKPTGEREATEK